MALLRSLYYNIINHTCPLLDYSVKTCASLGDRSLHFSNIGNITTATFCYTYTVTVPLSVLTYCALCVLNRHFAHPHLINCMTRQAITRLYVLYSARRGLNTAYPCEIIRCHVTARDYHRRSLGPQSNHLRAHPIAIL